MTEDKKLSILVVDDTPQNIDLLVEILQQEYRIQVASSGQRALDLATGPDKPDLILLDVMMPDMDGHEVCRRLKANPATTKIPVIFVTARSEVQDEMAGFRAGCVDYIVKPISPPTVQARVRTHLTLARTKTMLELAVRKRTKQLQEINTRLEQEVRRREEAMSRAEHLSQFDQLTGLPNRRQLYERLRHELQRAKQTGKHLCIARINFDRMQALNNNYGPSVGDAALALGTRRLQNAMDATDFLGRDEGDNFVAIFNHGWENAASARTQGIEITERILAQLDRPMNLGEFSTTLTASAGLVVFPEDAPNLERVLARAQTATGVAKQQGPGRVSAYSKSFGDAATTRFNMEGDLRRALATGELDIHFQPQIELSRNRMTGAEALVRWPDGRGGFVSNAEFIPIAEEAGMIIQLDHYVLRTLCDQAMLWGNDLPPGFRLGFNFSAVGFQDPQCVNRIIEIIETAKVPPHRFELEVTEQAVMTDFSSAISKLVALREFGLAIALDDFGTGYSSLAYLQQLPLDRLKIDRTFIREIESNAKSASIARAVIKLARTIGLDCLIEGVESAGQLEFCRLNGCQHVQGFYMYRPLPPDELMDLVHLPALPPQR